jgi:3-hydroxyacyl-[acyl-carrier-protein] dehydratase
VPGNRIDIEATLESYNRGLAKGRVVGYVNGEIACQIELVVAVPDIMTQFIPKK